MKKFWMTITAVMLAMTLAIAADVPISDFTEDTTPTGDDLLVTVDDPAGTPVNKKVTLTNVFASMLALVTIPEGEWHDVAGCDNASAGIIFDSPPTAPPTAACDTGSNTQKAVLNFDASTDQSFHFKKRLPSGYSTTDGITIIFRWKSVSTSGAAGWCLQLVRVPVGATSDPAFPAQGAGNCVSDTAAGTTLQENEATISNTTCTACVAGDMVYGRVSRDADGSAVTDSMTGAAALIGFWTEWRRSLL
jgi:hypothetical protein